MVNINDLIEWHRHNAAECRREGQEGERAFHELAVSLLVKEGATIDTIKTTGEKIFCLPCGEELDGAILTTEERPDLMGEECDTCGIRVG